MWLHARIYWDNQFSQGYEIGSHIRVQISLYLNVEKNLVFSTTTKIMGKSYWKRLLWTTAKKCDLKSLIIKFSHPISRLNVSPLIQISRQNLFMFLTWISHNQLLFAVIKICSILINPLSTSVQNQQKFVWKKIVWLVVYFCRFRLNARIFLNGILWSWKMFEEQFPKFSEFSEFPAFPENVKKSENYPLTEN